jgi:hypothetical protein
MDNSPSDVTDEVFSLFRDARARVITWPSDSTQIFQQIDVSLFGVLKRRGQYKLPIDEEDGTAAFYLRSIARSSKQ